ncbi:MAG: hypothetical protein Q8N51_16245 [Gammaproteobacteria bacterium]|nr:hypothetical protein [Gammaproteobacteria bacterium]
MNPNPPDQEHLRAAARELAGQGLSDRDVDEALHLPPGFSRGLLAADDSTRAAAHSEKTAA